MRAANMLVVGSVLALVSLAPASRLSEPSGSLRVVSEVGPSEVVGLLTVRSSERISVQSYLAVSRTLLDPLSQDPVRSISVVHEIHVDGERSGSLFLHEVMPGADATPLRGSLSSTPGEGDDSRGFSIEITVRPHERSWGEVREVGELEILVIGSAD